MIVDEVRRCDVPETRLGDTPKGEFDGAVGAFRLGVSPEARVNVNGMFCSMPHAPVAAAEPLTYNHSYVDKSQNMDGNCLLVMKHGKLLTPLPILLPHINLITVSLFVLSDRVNCVLQRFEEVIRFEEVWHTV